MPGIGNSLKIIKESSLVPNFADPLANAELALKEYEQGKTVLSTLPPVITLALTTHCYKEKPCLICDRNTRHPSSDSEIDAKVLNAAAPLLQTAAIVFLHCGGEAMFSPYFDEVIGIINPPTKVKFATNAMALTQKRSDKMLQHPIMAAITVSMDGATPETYRVMRPSCDFDVVKKNLLYYGARGKELAGENAPGFFLNMTLCKTNIRETVQFVELAVELGATGVLFNHLNAGLSHKVKTKDGWIWDYRDQDKFDSKKQHDEMVLKAYQFANAAGIKMAFTGEPFLDEGVSKQYKDVKTKLHDYSWLIPDTVWATLWCSSLDNPLDSGLPPCFKPWQEIVIQPNGNIRRCYFHDEGAWTLGNICEMDFMGIWNSEQMIDYRKEFLKRSISHICTSSTPCLHRGRK